MFFNAEKGILVVINDLTISLLVLVGIRFIASLMFIMLFFHHLKIKYLILAVGWLIYMAGPIPDLISSGAVTQNLHPFFGFSAAAGTFFLMISLILYFRDIRPAILIPFIVSVITVMSIVILLFPEVSGTMATLTQGLLLICILILVFMKQTIVKKSKSTQSFFWLCSTLILGLFHAFGFTLIFGTVPLSVRFVMTFMINVSFLELFIYLDWEQSFDMVAESDARYRFLFNTAPVALFEEDCEEVKTILARLKGGRELNTEEFFSRNRDELKKIQFKLNILEVNNQTLSLFEADSREALQNNIDKLFVDDTYNILIKTLHGMLNRAGYSSYETVIRTLKGNTKDVIMSCYYPERVNLDNKTVISMVDITEKNEVQKALEISLREKEVLLQEVHHRVNNNLAIISSILGLQSRAVEDPEMRGLIQSIENRISTMALVHEQLYTCRDLEDIDAGDYIRQLTDGLSINMYNDNKPVHIILELLPVKFSLNILIPLGMYINEIVSNSFKHAFVDTEKPEVRIRLFHENKDNYTLSISDNGVGLSDRLEFYKAESTGFIIIDALAHQIEAELLINNENGTEFQLLLPDSKVII